MPLDIFGAAREPRQIVVLFEQELRYFAENIDIAGVFRQVSENRFYNSVKGDYLSREMSRAAEHRPRKAVVKARGINTRKQTPHRMSENNIRQSGCTLCHNSVQRVHIPEHGDVTVGRTLAEHIG